MHHSAQYVMALILFIGAMYTIQSAIIKPNPIISRGNGVTVKASSGDVTGINNNKFGIYETKPWTISDNSWVALKLASGPAKIFITFNCPDTSWSDSIGLAADSCKKTVRYPIDYDIMTSANSTDGAYNLIPGVDFFAYLTNKQKMGYLDLDNKAGVLPNNYGNFELQREWVKKMDTVVYKKVVDVSTPKTLINSKFDIALTSCNGILTITTEQPGTAIFYSTNGRRVDEIAIAKPCSYIRSEAPGCYLIQFTSLKGTVTKRIVNY